MPNPLPEPDVDLATLRALSEHARSDFRRFAGSSYPSTPEADAMGAHHWLRNLADRVEAVQKLTEYKAMLYGPDDEATFTSDVRQIRASLDPLQTLRERMHVRSYNRPEGAPLGPLPL